VINTSLRVLDPSQDLRGALGGVVHRGVHRECDMSVVSILNDNSQVALAAVDNPHPDKPATPGA
jgi:hypothetical protein